MDCRYLEQEEFETSLPNGVELLRPPNPLFCCGHEPAIGDMGEIVLTVAGYRGVGRRDDLVAVEHEEPPTLFVRGGAQGHSGVDTIEPEDCYAMRRGDRHGGWRGRAQCRHKIGVGCQKATEHRKHRFLGG